MTRNRQEADKRQTPERDPWFNGFRFPNSRRASELVQRVFADVEKSEVRERKRSPENQNWLQEAVSSLVCDLAHHQLLGRPGAGLVVPRAKSVISSANRYRSPVVTRSFPELLDTLEGLQYLEQHKGAYSGLPGQSRRTTIKAGRALIHLVAQLGLMFQDFALSENEEVIVLKKRKEQHWDRSERIDYADTRETEQLRAELHRINSWLANANIEFDNSSYASPVDATARRLYRYFAGDFESGGRLFRGFWENLPKPVRLRGIIIEREPVLELDYAQLNPTLAYAELGKAAPADAYKIDGFESFRDGVKKVFNALLFDTRERTSFPEKVRPLFPPTTKVANVIAAIRSKHSALTPILSSGAGFRLMYTESEIMMRVLNRLRLQGIVALPIFDAVLVKASEVDRAKAAMVGQFRAITRQDIQVRIEGL